MSPLKYLLHAKSQHKNDPFLWEIKIIATKCCSECDSLHDLRMPIDEALKSNLLPYAKCTRPTGCVCCYVARAKRDNDGNLIRVNKT